MLRRVTCGEVKLGMFLHRLEGPWFAHPFWRRSFLLTDPDDLDRLLRSEIDAVIIDESRGLSADRPATPAREEAHTAAPLRRDVPATIAAPARAALLYAGVQRPTSLAEERGRAQKIIAKSKRAVMQMFGDARLGKAIRAANVAPLVDEISASVARNPAALIGIVRLKTKDEYTYLHSVAVCALMINLARTLELDEETVRQCGMAGLLHDVGKMAVPDALLNKPGRLSDDEFSTIRTHPARGYGMLAESGEIPEMALDVCLHHHEKYDGTGYPEGLKGEAISLAARMGAICDVYDAITSTRPYKDAWAAAEAVGRMLEWDGHFDPKLLDKFVRSIGIYPIGTLVRLRSNRLALVRAENCVDPTRPRVRIFYSIMERRLIAPEDLVIAGTLKGDQIVGIEQPEFWNLGDWATLRERLIAGDCLTDLLRAA
jgi:putative nucleotidyltransferase with HDIG domain